MAEKFNEQVYYKKILNGFRSGFRNNGLVFMKQVKDQIIDETYVDPHFSKEYMLAIWQTASDEKDERLTKVSAAKNSKRLKAEEASES